MRVADQTLVDIYNAWIAAGKELGCCVSERDVDSIDVRGQPALDDLDAPAASAAFAAIATDPVPGELVD